MTAYGYSVILWHGGFVCTRLNYVHTLNGHDGNGIVALGISSVSGDIVSASHTGKLSNFSQAFTANVIDLC